MSIVSILAFLPVNSQGLVDIDIDDALKFAPWFLPETKCVFVSFKAKKSLGLPRSESKTNKKFGTERMIVEVGGNRLCTVFHTSVHESGDAIVIVHGLFQSLQRAGQLGFEFKPDLDFAKELICREHPNGNLVTIYYVTDRQWSRKRKEAFLEDGSTILDRMIKATKELFTSGHLLWHANKAVLESPFDPPAQRLPNKPHGLNVFTDYDDVVFLSSLNPTTEHFRFLKSQGIEGDEVRGFTYLSAAYQAIMRTSIRDTESLSPKRILVPDLPLAECLHELLPGSKLEKLDIGLVERPPKKSGRPGKHATNRERVAA